LDPIFEKLCINTIRFLAVDAIEKAASGHPGAPMGMAPLAYTLWQRFLKHNPQNPNWPDRDRFVLSAGHASTLLYALLHLTGYDLSLDDIKNFRQWDSRTPGHPERGVTPGVEATTGPLGQGFVNAVGMAIAERHLAERYNRPGFSIVNHYTYSICSDGDLMEGITSEAASLAGVLKLGKLIFLYDSNNITIEGSTSLSFKEDIPQRFRSYGWHVVGPINGMDTKEVGDAIRESQIESGKPSLIICNTIIGYGSPNKAGKPSCHGEPLGKEEAKLARDFLNWPHYEPFSVPETALQHFRAAIAKGNEYESAWKNLFAKYAAEYPKEAKMFDDEMSGKLPFGWDSGLGLLFSAENKPMATREASGIILNSIASKVPNLLGGSADLAPSTKTLITGSSDFTAKSYEGRNIRFGIREHAMGAIAHGISLHGGLIPYTATFLMFYDYMRPSVRLAALTKSRVIFIFTHDSIGVGEDGPTHQPIEHINGLRSVPELVTIRPADAKETVEAWRIAMNRSSGPTALLLTRQAVPTLDREELSHASGVQRGAYTLYQSSESPQILLIATGSEVHIALEASKILKGKCVASRVVSMPSWELFEAQTAEYRQSVLPQGVKARISIEAGSTIGWSRYTGSEGVNIGVDRFGASAPGKTLYEQFGITVNRVVETALKMLNLDQRYLEK